MITGVKFKTPHVSCYNCIFKVWDVTTKLAVATFVDPYISVNPVVVWSPVDPDLIITGDWLIRVWRISKNPPKTGEGKL